MRCEACHGRGTVWVPGRPPVSPVTALQASDDGRAIELTCQECNGCGVTHCCDGMCAQPQTDF
jgi:hypothetical protein